MPAQKISLFTSTTTAALLAFSLLGAAAAAQTSSTEPDPASHTRVGDRMPAFNVEQVSGGAFSLAAQKGKVVLVNFWATWCGPCQLEMPRLQKEIWTRYKSPDFAMIAIAREQTVPVVAAFQKQKPYTFPLAFDPKRSTYALFADSGIPRNYVVDRQGKIVFQTVGYDPSDFDQLKAAIDHALAEK